LGAIADLKKDNELLQAEVASLREANAANTKKIDDLAAMIGRPRRAMAARPPPARPSEMDVDAEMATPAAQATPRATPSAPPPPAPRQGPKRSRDKVSGGLASPPDTSRTPKAVRIESPPPTLMHSRYATGSPLRNEGSSMNTNVRVSTGEHRKAEERG